MHAQVVNFSGAPGGRLYCVWNQVTLRSGPGKEGSYLTGVYFGEVVEKTGEEAYSREEQRTYIKVRTTEGVVGWVHEFLFVEGLGMGVVMEPGRIYKRPKTVSTLTDQSFVPGELVVIVSENDGWVNLISREKKKLGWIEGPQKITNSQQEMELASLLYDAQQKKKPEDRQVALNHLLSESRSLRSPLTQAIEMTINGQQYSMPLVDARQTSVAASPFTPQPTLAQRSYSAQPPQAQPYLSQPSASQPSSFSQPPSSRSDQSGFSSGYVNSANPTSYTPTYQSNSRTAPSTTNQSGLVSETGVATIIADQLREPDIYYAYHRQLSPGSKVFLDIPGNAGFIEVRIIGRLPAGSPYVLGLSSACYDILLRNSSTREVSLTYQR
ncbi:MAG: SH3 domain-containing protein [Bacteroidia bacterium]|nr:SH3 domain-containing protein [Bacteroidia bacterium]